MRAAAWVVRARAVYLGLGDEGNVGGGGGFDAGDAGDLAGGGGGVVAWVELGVEGLGQVG